MNILPRLQKRTFYVLGILPGLIFMFWLEWQSSQNPWGVRRFTLFDDAMISMDYGRTLARNGELAWFPGAPRVQGFTNPLWTLWMSVIHLIGFNGSLAALMVSLSGIVLIVASSWIIYDLITTYGSGNSQLIATVAAGSLPFLYPLTYWTLRGMEVGALTFFSLLLLRSTLTHVRNGNSNAHSSLYVPIILGIATRFDFIIFCAVAILSLVAWGDKASKNRLATKYGSTAIAAAAAVSLAQKLYWGSWLPNTYHLKMDGVSPVDRIARGFASSSKTAALFAVVAIAVLSQWRSKQVWQRVSVIGSAMFVSMAAYAVYIGGDAWEGEMLNRFYATVLPFVVLVIGLSFNVIRHRINPLLISIALLLTSIGAGVMVNPFEFSNKHFYIVVSASIISAMLVVVSTFIKRDGWTASVIVASICLTVSIYPLAKQYKNHDVLSSRTNLFVTESVETMRDTTNTEAVIATVWAGVPAYYSNRKMLDLLGKNDTFIASSLPHGAFFPGHNKWDYNYSIAELQPDVIFQTFDRRLENDLNQRIIDWGYTRLCPSFGTFGVNGYYYRTNSKFIKWELLRECSQ
jgi:hypothetical protein